MTTESQHAPSQGLLTSCFRSGDALRSRSVSSIVRTGVIDVPMPPARLVVDWERDIASQLQLEPGDVEPLPLARARARWPDYQRCVQAAADWAHTHGLSEALAASDIALMACRGARYHHDGAQYGAAAFCNLFVSEDKGLDVHFPGTGQRIPLVRGTVLLFDTGQPHAVIRRGSSGFDAGDFATGHDVTQVFLTWELPIENAHVARALQIAFDIDPSAASRLDEEQVLWNGARARVCPASGRWIHDDVVTPRCPPA
ncbi:hypothetical protein ACSFA7_29810 [Variovorax sp. LT1R20]|uniref:hypothetical protein n=1 Tax=Variovorax sp. LT1R20 TaxID=3443729 RepID=UPI003F45EAA2